MAENSLNMFMIEYVVTNTFFQMPPRRLYTWRPLVDKVGHIERKQIIYNVNKLRDSIIKEAMSKYIRDNIC